jgi:hypothetical protein
LKALSINISPFHKLERCPYCGKWAAVRRKSLDELRAAEREELKQAAGTLEFGLSEEEKLRRELENTRYRE